MAGALDTLLGALAVVGTAAFAISGALAASRKRMDPAGFLLVAAVTAFGGGTVRDLLLGRRVAWLDEPGLVGVAVAAATLVFAASTPFARRGRRLEWADAAGLAAFTVLGAEAALRDGASPWVAVLMGTMTASFGGLMRDVICGEVPLVLRREIYATAAALGAAVLVAAERWDLGRDAAVALGALAAFALRGAALARGWSLPVHRGAG